MNRFPSAQKPCALLFILFHCRQLTNQQWRLEGHRLSYFHVATPDVYQYILQNEVSVFQQHEVISTVEMFGMNFSDVKLSVARIAVVLDVSFVDMLAILREAIETATSNALCMLTSLAMPFPTISKAVPCAGVAITTGRPPWTVTPPSNDNSFIAIWP